MVSIHSLAKGKKVVIFSVLGAFTFTCSLKQVPGFIERTEELKAKSVDNLICILVKDPHVMNAWAKNLSREQACEIFLLIVLQNTCML